MTAIAVLSGAVLGFLPAVMFWGLAARGFDPRRAAVIGEIIGLLGSFFLLYLLGKENERLKINGYFAGIIFGQAIIVFKLISEKTK